MPRNTDRHRPESPLQTVFVVNELPSWVVDAVDEFPLSHMILWKRSDFLWNLMIRDARHLGVVGVMAITDMLRQEREQAESAWEQSRHQTEGDDDLTWL